MKKFKQGYFLEWRIADKVKAECMDRMAYFIDANRDDDLVMISRDLFEEALIKEASEPFRVVPYFDPGVWGGQWMKKVCGLDPDKSNYAWSFDGVPEENSICFDFEIVKGGMDMILNEELLAVQRGEQGEAMRKVLNTLVMYGEAFGAERMVKITGKMGHSVIGTGSMTWKPVFDLMEELIDGGALPRQSFTTDPRGVESHVPMSFADRAMFKVIFSGQKRMEQEWERMGIKDSNAYTCTAYMKEVGNIPQYGDILGWAESSAVSYVNSVIGARCNRNSGILELMSNILGYVPEFGLLVQESADLCHRYAFQAPGSGGSGVLYAADPHGHRRQRQGTGAHEKEPE